MWDKGQRTWRVHSKSQAFWWNAPELRMCFKGDMIGGDRSALFTHQRQCEAWIAEQKAAYMRGAYTPAVAAAIDDGRFFRGWP